MTIEERFAPGVFALCSLVMFSASRVRLLNAQAPITEDEKRTFVWIGLKKGLRR